MIQNLRLMLSKIRYCNNSRSSYIDTTNPVLDTDITPYIQNLKKQLEKVNMDVPEPIQKMKTFRDYYELFKNEDFYE